MSTMQLTYFVAKLLKTHPHVEKSSNAYPFWDVQKWMPLNDVGKVLHNVQNGERYVSQNTADCFNAIDIYLRILILYYGYIEG